MGISAATGWADGLLVTSGWVLLAVGGLLLLWALFSDRSRGRKRCPKCWYDMSGAVARQEEDGRGVFTCPECGRVVKGERGLRKTRRRWGRAVFAVALLAGSYAAMSVRDVRERGWWAAAPRPVLILAVPWVPDVLVGQHLMRTPSPLETEIRLRLGASSANWPRLWPGEGALLRSVAQRAVERPRSENAQALAADLLARYSGTAYDDVNDTGKARVALAKSWLLYARCTTYRDVGMVKGSIGIRDERPFTTAFVRPGTFRFEYLGLHPHERTFSMRYVVWGTEPAINDWWTLGTTPGQSTTIMVAIAGPTGVSGGSASTIPMQLIQSAGWLTRLDSPRLIGRESFDGHECVIIRSEGLFSDIVDVWLDAETFALRKLQEHGQFPAVTVYRPEFDVVMDKEEFEFDPVVQGPSRLGDGEAVCEELRELAGDPRKDAIPSP